MKRSLFAAHALCVLVFASLALALNSSPMKVFFKNLKNGEHVSSPVKVEMGAENVTIGKAGAVVAGEGHHHLIVDGGPIPAGTVIPADATHLHFGQGQTEAQVELAPGKHKLTLQLADGLHQSYGPAASATVEIEVVGK